jgi:hypothetical protein
VDASVKLQSSARLLDYTASCDLIECSHRCACLCMLASARPPRVGARWWCARARGVALLAPRLLLVSCVYLLARLAYSYPLSYIDESRVLHLALCSTQRRWTNFEFVPTNPPPAPRHCARVQSRATSETGKQLAYRDTPTPNRIQRTNCAGECARASTHSCAHNCGESARGPHRSPIERTASMQPQIGYAAGCRGICGGGQCNLCA